MERWLVIAGLVVASGVLGRAGGAHGYNTKWRDIGCPAIIVLMCWMFLGWHPFVYLAAFLLSWGAFSTYWDWLWDGVDNLWFSGFMVGIALSPIIFIDKNLFTFVIIRSIVLMAIWGSLNAFLPNKVLCWRRDVVEEFSRYAVAL